MKLSLVHLGRFHKFMLGKRVDFSVSRSSTNNDKDKFRFVKVMNRRVIVVQILSITPLNPPAPKKNIWNFGSSSEG